MTQKKQKRPSPSRPIPLKGFNGNFSTSDIVKVSRIPSAHIPFHASQPHKTCRISKVPEACWADEPGGKRLKKPWTKTDKTAEQKKVACEAAGGVFTEKSVKSNRADKAELELLSPTQARKLKTQSGPNLRLCFADGKPGRLMPVATPEEARFAKLSFDTCIAGDKKKAAKCAAVVAGPNAPLGLFSADSAGPGMMRSIFGRGRS